VLFAACERETCPQPTPRPLEHGGVGEPCSFDTHCGPGLSCRTVYVVPGYDAPSFTANACTLPCDAGCPGNGVCGQLSSPQRDGGVQPFDTCLRTCAADDDCRKGTSAGVCDGGACYRLQCTMDSQCPAGFTCEIPAVVCCPRGETCGFSGPVPGYCRRS
jgi:hypothetical protein